MLTTRANPGLIAALLVVALLGGACASTGTDADLEAALDALEEATEKLEEAEAALAEAATSTVLPATSEPPATTAAPATTEPPATTAAPTTTEPPATTAAPTTTEAPACPAIDPIPAEAVVNDPTPADVDGDGDDEQAFTYFLPSADIWHLRVVDGATEHDHTVVGSSMVWESTVLGARDIDDEPIGAGRIR